MPREKKAAAKGNGNGANLGFEATLWAAADKLRNNMDAAEYKHVVLGLIFLKYISDAFKERHDFLLTEKAGPIKDGVVHGRLGEIGVKQDRSRETAANQLGVG